MFHMALLVWSVPDGILFWTEWKGIPKKSENEVAQNGGAEAAHNEPVSPIPKALPVPIPVPMPAPITVPPPQVRAVPQK